MQGAVGGGSGTSGQAETFDAAVVGNALTQLLCTASADPGTRHAQLLENRVDGERLADGGGALIPDIVVG